MEGEVATTVGANRNAGEAQTARSSEGDAIVVPGE